MRLLTELFHLWTMPGTGVFIFDWSALAGSTWWNSPISDVSEIPMFQNCPTVLSIAMRIYKTTPSNRGLLLALAWLKVIKRQIIHLWKLGDGFACGYGWSVEWPLIVHAQIWLSNIGKNRELFGTLQKLFWVETHRSSGMVQGSEGIQPCHFAR